MKILSCGAGMQSTALALMSCENKIAAGNGHGTVHPLVPIYDAVIFCDLGMEPPWVMAQVHFIRRACESAGIHFKILDSPLYADFMKNFGERRTISIPWWTIKDDGHKSKMPRNCTIDYKVEVISKYVRWELLGYRKGQRLRPADQKAHEMHIPYEQNPELQQLTDALVHQSSEELYNITRSTGFMLDNGHGGKVFTPLADVYNGYLDDAIAGMTNGAYDYNTLVRRMVSQMTASGLRTDHPFSDGGSDYGVDYASGWHNRVDVAARRALLTGFGQLTGHVTDLNAQRLGTDYFEVTWHAGARPDHAAWQGKVYTKEQLTTKCGLGTGPGLLGWNCRHTYYPFIPGVSERLYTDEWLEEQNARENTPRRFRGKEYTTYEATQKQRQMETAMRARREQVQLLRAGGADKEDITIARCKYQAQLEQYRSFSKAMGLEEQTERIYTGRTPGRISPSPQVYAQWQAEQAAKAANRAKERAEKQRRAAQDAAQKGAST